MQSEEKVCLYADECEKKYLNIKHVKVLWYYSQQTIQRNYTANVKEFVDMFNSFHLSSIPQKVW